MARAYVLERQTGSILALDDPAYLTLFFTFLYHFLFFHSFYFHSFRFKLLTFFLIVNLTFFDFLRFFWFPLSSHLQSNAYVVEEALIAFLLNSCSPSANPCEQHAGVTKILDLMWTCMEVRGRNLRLLTLKLLGRELKDYSVGRNCAILLKIMGLVYEEIITVVMEVPRRLKYVLETKGDR